MYGFRPGYIAPIDITREYRTEFNVSDKTIGRCNWYF